jgi:hypothetical protein
MLHYRVLASVPACLNKHRQLAGSDRISGEKSMECNQRWYATIIRQCLELYSVMIMLQAFTCAEMSVFHHHQQGCTVTLRSVMRTRTVQDEDSAVQRDYRSTHADSQKDGDTDRFMVYRK